MLFTERAHDYRKGRPDLEMLCIQHLWSVQEESPEEQLGIGFQTQKEKLTRDMNSRVIGKSLKPPRKEWTVQRRVSWQAAFKEQEE